MMFDTRLWERASCSKRDKKKIVPVLESIVRLSGKARREGLLSIEADLAGIGHRFVKDGLGLVVDGYDPAVVTGILLTKIHAGGFSGRELLERMAAMEGILCLQEGYSPSVLRKRLFAFLGEEFEADEEAGMIASPASFPEPYVDISLFERTPADEACAEKMRLILLDNRRIINESPVTVAEIGALAEAANSSEAGVRTLTGFLRSLPEGVGEKIAEGFSEYDPALYEKITKEWFVFDDLSLCDCVTIQKIMREIDASDLAMALRGARTEIREKIFAGVSAHEAEMLREDLGYSGPVPVDDIRAAQEKIAAVMKKLSDMGEIAVPRPVRIGV